MTINSKRFEVVDGDKKVEGNFILTQDGRLQKETKIKDDYYDIHHTIVEDVDSYGYQLNWLD